MIAQHLPEEDRQDARNGFAGGPRRRAGRCGRSRSQSVGFSKEIAYVERQAEVQ